MKLIHAAMTLCATAALPLAAQAELIAIDWKTAGDQLLVKDSDSGLQWLRVSFTRGQSFDAVTARLQSDLAGCSFATVAQVGTFFSNARAAGPDGIQRLVDLWGPGRNWSAGLVGVSAITQTVHAAWPDSLSVAEAAYQSDPASHPESPSFANAMNGSIVHDFGHRAVGSALVRVSDVPEPATWLLSLVGFGAVAMLMSRGRRPTLRR